MSNPMLTRQFETTAQPPIVTSEGMTVAETARNTFALLLAAFASGTWAWMNAANWPVWVLWVSLFAGLGLVIAATVKPVLAQYLAIPYALTQGILLGLISRMYEDLFDGIVFQAILATVAVFAVMLFLYTARIIQVTQRLRSAVIGATLGIMVFYGISLIGMLFGWNMPLVWDSGPLGIIFSIVVAGVAAFNLLLDFDLIENGVRANLPDWMNWFAAMGLMVTIVWLYLELLRLISKLRD